MAVSRSAAAAELGAELKRLRTEAALNSRQFGGLIGVTSGTISHWENGNRLIAADRLAALLDALKVTGDDREYLVGLRRAAEGPGVLGAGSTSIGPLLAQLIEHEEVARRIVHFELGMIPGLLQTAAYARAVMGDIPDANVRAKLRVGRSEILTRESNPVEFLALIESEVLVRPVASKDVMVQQFKLLLKMQELPNVTIRIVPSTVPGYHPGLHGPFKIFQFPSAAPIVHVENYRASPFLWDEEYVDDYLRAAEEIQKRAMTPERTSEAIEEMLHGLET